MRLLELRLLTLFVPFAIAAFAAPACTSHETDEPATAEPSQAVSAPALVPQGDFTWDGKLSAGQVLEIKNINGAIEVEQAGSGQAHVSAVKKVRRGNPDDVRVVAVKRSDGITICTVYPGMDSSCRGGGTFDNEGIDISVKFSVKLPPGVRFEGRTVNGSIRTDVAQSDVDAKTVNGSLNIRAAKSASAESVNGGIKAALSAPSGKGTLAFKTVNGSIKVSLPKNISAVVSGDTLHGSIHTDFPLSIDRGQFVGARLRGTLGSGGRKLKLKTVNGSIRLLEG